MAERDLIGRVGDRLVRRRARTADGERLNALGEHRKQRHLARDVRRDDRGYDRPVDDDLDELAVDLAALNQLGDAMLAELDRAEVLERRARSGERRANAGDDGHTT